VQVFHLHSNSSASRRTKPALNAFAITFPGRTHKMITDQIRSTVYLIDPKRPNRPQGERRSTKEPTGNEATSRGCGFGCRAGIYGRKRGICW
jgi:hypothetical protein